jgi:nicotinamidase/pyrazinamidase
VIFHKATIDVWANLNAARLVERLEVGEYVVFGVATDYCVVRAALGLLRWGHRVAVVTDAIRAVADQTGSAALDQMAGAGARFVSTDEVVRGIPQ